LYVSSDALAKEQDAEQPGHGRRSQSPQTIAHPALSRKPPLEAVIARRPSGVTGSTTGLTRNA
jgi:hypothetical protein